MVEVVFGALYSNIIVVMSLKKLLKNSWGNEILAVKNSS